MPTDVQDAKAPREPFDPTTARDLIACPVRDLSAFAKSLRAQWRTHLEAHDAPPGALPSHLTLLNMLARAAGHRNVQALKASQPVPVPVPASSPAHTPPPANTTSPNLDHVPARQRLAPRRGPSAPGLTEAADRALRQFDVHGRLARWPTKFSVQRLAMWGLWMRFDAKRPYTEREVNSILRRWHAFGDHCTLRRELVTMRLLERTPDGAVYRKYAARPDAETRALLHALRQSEPVPA